MFRITYNALGVKLTGTLQYYGGCAKLKAKARAVRKNTYVSITAGRKDFCVYDWSISVDYNWESGLDQSSRLLHPLFLEFLEKIKSQLPKKMEYFFKNNIITWDSS